MVYSARLYRRSRSSVATWHRMCIYIKTTPLKPSTYVREESTKQCGYDDVRIQHAKGRKERMARTDRYMITSTFTDNRHHKNLSKRLFFGRKRRALGAQPCRHVRNMMTSAYTDNWQRIVLRRKKKVHLGDATLHGGGPQNLLQHARGRQQPRRLAHRIDTLIIM